MGDEATVGGRPGYWFPLVLLGFGLLTLLGCEAMSTPEDFGWFAYTPSSDGLLNPGAQYLVPETSFSAVSVMELETGQYPMRDFGWLVLLTTTVVATMAWYGWRARKAGGSVRPYVMLAVGAGIAVPVAYVATGMASSVADPAGMVTSVGLPLVGLGVVTGVWSYLRLGPWRRGTAMISVASLMIGVGTVLGTWSPGLLEPMIITGGLLALARFERSRLLAIVAVVVLAAMVVYPFGTSSMLVPAMVVLAAAIATLLRHQGGTPEPTA